MDSKFTLKFKVKTFARKKLAQNASEKGALCYRNNISTLFTFVLHTMRELAF